MNSENCEMCAGKGRVKLEISIEPNLIACPRCAYMELGEKINAAEADTAKLKHEQQVAYDLAVLVNNSKSPPAPTELPASPTETSSAESSDGNGY